MDEYVPERVEFEGELTSRLVRAKYQCNVDVSFPCQITGKPYPIGILCSKGGSHDKRIAFVIRWQSGSGSAERKVPFEAICLSSVVDRHDLAKAFLVLGGNGWTLADFFCSGGMREWVRLDERVSVVTADTLLERTW